MASPSFYFYGNLVSRKIIVVSKIVKWMLSLCRKIDLTQHFCLCSPSMLTLHLNYPYNEKAYDFVLIPKGLLSS